MAGSDVYAKNRYNCSVLHVAIFSSSDKEILDILLMAGSSIHDRTDEGNTAFHMTCVHDKMDYAVTLLAAGSDINNKDTEGDSVLFDAIWAQHKQMVEFLLYHGVRIQDSNKHGCSLLHIIACWGTLDTVAPFMSCQRLGVLDAEKKDKAGLTPWETLEARLTKPEGFVEVFEALLAQCRAQRNASMMGVEPVEIGD